MSIGVPMMAQQPQIPEDQQFQISHQEYNVAADSLVPALRSFARSTNILLTFTADQTDGRISAGLGGSYSVEECG